MIDSQASRREHMPRAAAAASRRGAAAGRRRRPLLEEPPEKAPVEVVEQPPTKVNSGATVREVAETLGLGSAEVIKRLMEMGEMATLTQTLPDETVAALAQGARPEGRDRQRRRGGARASRLTRTPTQTSRSARRW